MRQEGPFSIPKGLVWSPSLRVICWSTCGKFSTTESPLIDRILPIVSAALNIHNKESIKKGQY
jgi:hypothetical protein